MQTIASSRTSVVQTQDGLDSIVGVPDALIVDRFAYRVVKRPLDIVVAGLGLLILSPFLLIVGLLVKLTSPGPVLYPWDVIGRGGRPFRGYKFRTMVQNADELKAQLMHKNEMTGPVFKMEDDPRITPLGRFLRKYSIDELPQLWSVLKGDMSLVGPRPVLTYEWIWSTSRTGRCGWTSRCWPGRCGTCCRGGTAEGEGGRMEDGEWRMESGE